MPTTEANVINVTTSGAVAFTGTAFTSGTLSIANGGTNAASFTQSNGIVTYNGTRLVNYAGPQIDSSGRMTNTTQPAFLAYLNGSAANVSGNGTQYTFGTSALTKIFDNDTNFNTNGTFTAPVTGQYSFYAGAYFDGNTVATSLQVRFIASSISIFCTFNRAAGAQDLDLNPSVFINMTAADTIHMVFLVSGEAGQTSDLEGVSGGNILSYFGGYLVC